MVVTWIQESMHLLLRDIATLLFSCTAITIWHVYREANLVIDMIASYVVEHLGDFLWTDMREAPSQLCDIIFFYFIGCIHTKLLQYEYSVLLKKGFSQRKGDDFEEIFSLVMKMSSIRVMLGLATSLDLEIEQMDMKITFLHGDLEKTIYMEQPKGFQVKCKGNLVYKLNKSLYGLKQVLR